MAAKLKLDVVHHTLVASLFADDTVLFPESKEMLQRVVHAFNLEWRRSLKESTNKSKVIFFKTLERRWLIL